MWLRQTSISLVKLFFLKAKPSDLPYSKLILAFCAIGFVLVKCVTDMWFVDIVNNFDEGTTVDLSFSFSLFMALVWLLLLYAIVRTALVYYKMTDRLVQTMTAFLWVDFVLAVLFLTWVALLSIMELPLEPNSIPALFMIISFVLLIYWQFMVYINIIANVLDVSLIKAGIFTLFYMILQYNISEILINFMVTVH